MNIVEQGYIVEQNLISNEQQKWNTRIALYLAIGGDWFADQTEEKLCP